MTYLDVEQGLPSGKDTFLSEMKVCYGYDYSTGNEALATML